MSLSGKLETMALSEVLQWIAGSHKTGTLYVRRHSVEKRITFKEGAIYSSWSNHPRESLGQLLVRDRLVTEEQLFRALHRQEKEGRMLGSILVGDGILTLEQLEDALRTKAEEAVYDLFLWAEGEFSFRDGDFAEMFHVDLSVTHVILEGVWRVDEWSRIRAAFPCEECSFQVRDGAAAEDPAEAEALRLAAEGRTLPEIALEMRRSEFHAACILYALYERGLLAADETRPDPASGADPVTAIARLLEQADDSLRQHRFQAAADAYEGVLALDRLNQNARKGLLAAQEALSRPRAVVPLDAVPVLAMSLASLTSEVLDPQEGFVLSRVNGSWDVRSILKICPIAEQEALEIFGRLLDRKVIALEPPP